MTPTVTGDAADGTGTPATPQIRTVHVMALQPQYQAPEPEQDLQPEPQQEAEQEPRQEPEQEPQQQEDPQEQQEAQQEQQAEPEPGPSTSMILHPRPCPVNLTVSIPKYRWTAR